MHGMSFCTNIACRTPEEQVQIEKSVSVYAEAKNEANFSAEDAPYLQLNDQ